VKVPFEEVPDLVSSRRVFLSKGYAYVAMSQVRYEFMSIRMINSIQC
jgi:DNA primase large subunit